MCKIEQRITPLQKKRIKLEVTKKYKVASQDRSYKKRVSNGQFDEFERMKSSGNLGKAVMCSALKDKWL
ncbi:MAG: hypothetical protein V7735_21430 [Photobacterium frigidiphilum]|uniref:hypothetical protein n=1 Tax=Photobacterium frigidiphilum TaxID=264736 RepID=UPI0030017821